MLSDLSTASIHILDGMKETTVKAITNTKRICMQQWILHNIISYIGHIVYRSHECSCIIC